MEGQELRAVADIVIDEVRRTTPVRLAFRLAPWFGTDADKASGKVYGVLHLDDLPPAEDPEAPYGVSVSLTQAIFAWEHYLGNAAMFEEMLCQVADVTTELIQTELWARRLDPSWPPCPEHAGQHPLRPVLEYLGDVHRPVPTAVWRCYQPVAISKEGEQVAYGPTAIPIGKLAIRDGLSALQVD